MNDSTYSNTTNNGLHYDTSISKYQTIINIAFASFIAHGFLDFWPLCKKWDWTLSLPYYLLVSIGTIYLYSEYTLIVQLLFYGGSAYHFGSDWKSKSKAFFLGNILIGIAMGRSIDILKQLGIPNSNLLGIVAFYCGIISLLPFYNYPLAVIMMLIGFLGLYGVMIYAVFIHTPRSVYLLTEIYGKRLYFVWIGLTIVVFIFMTVLKQYINIEENILLGLMYGILFAHIICTSMWRNVTDDILISIIHRYLK